MKIEPVAYFHSPFTSKFGIPRQSGIVKELKGTVVFTGQYAQREALSGIEAYDYLWLIWGFSANRHDAAGLTVRPPRLGGNERVGVFASRSPFRPNGLGLTCVHIINIEMHPHLGPVIHVQGADLMDGTPIYDVKPYVRYADSHPEAQSGFVDEKEWKSQEVDIPQEVAACFTAEELQGLREVLSLDPRPQYHHDAERIYGMPYAGRDVRFKVADGKVQVIGQTPLRK
jgi:tRNA-Thr(GGU) m(6)t(6)A37 methyltransferase TsaA